MPTEISVALCNLVQDFFNEKETLEESVVLLNIKFMD